MTDAIFKTFKALVPNTIGDTQFPAGAGFSDIAEPDTTRLMPDGTTGEADWVYHTKTYAANERAIYNHRVYITATAGISDITPPNDPTRWTDEGPTNRWACFDIESATRTTWPSALTMTVRPGAITHIGLAGMKNVASVHVEMWSSPGGELVHDHTYTTNDTSSNTPLWDLYFRAPTYSDLKVIGGLPVYPQCQVRITLTAYTYPLQIGLIALGRTHTLGLAEVEASVIYRDYGYTTVNKWGNTVRTPGAKAKDLKCTAYFPIEEANNVDRAMRLLLDSGAIFIPSEQAKFNFMTTWGLIKPADITATSNTLASASFEIEGLI